MQRGGPAGVPGVDAHDVDLVLLDARQKRGEVVNLGVFQHHRHARRFLQHRARERLGVVHQKVLHRAALIPHAHNLPARILILQRGDVLRERPRVGALGVDLRLEALFGDGQLGLIVLDDGPALSPPGGALAGKAALQAVHG